MGSRMGDEEPEIVNVIPLVYEPAVLMKSTDFDLYRKETQEWEESLESLRTLGQP